MRNCLLIQPLRALSFRWSAPVVSFPSPLLTSMSQIPWTPENQCVAGLETRIIHFHKRTRYCKTENSLLIAIYDTSMSRYMSNVSTVKSSSLLILNELWEIIRLRILGTHQLSILSSQPVFLSTNSWSLVFSCWISTRTKFRLRCSFTICQLVSLNVDTVPNCFFGQIFSNNSPHLKNLMFMYSPRFSHFLSFTTHRENLIENNDWLGWLTLRDPMKSEREPRGKEKKLESRFDTW